MMPSALWTYDYNQIIVPSALWTDDVDRANFELLYHAGRQLKKLKDTIKELVQPKEQQELYKK